MRNASQRPPDESRNQTVPPSFPPLSSTVLHVRHYNLETTLDSGQVFRWQKHGDAWLGFVGKRPVRLTQTCDGIQAETAVPVINWNWLCKFLQTEIDLAAVLKTFPDDQPMHAAVNACKGLRVLRQDPWECLASFILSSNKQITHIRQAIAALCERFGESLACPSDTLSPSDGERDGMRGMQFIFPTPQRIAAATEFELRACKVGFRAPYLLAAARQIAEGKFDLDRPRHIPLVEARAELTRLPGVGDKIADCVLLFAYGSNAAFPVDVWVERALRQLYFPRRRVTPKRLRHFAATHFGPYAGYAQQYLFHYMRTKMR